MIDSIVKWGVIGVGNVCERKSAPAMNLVPNSQLEAVMRRDEEKVKDYAKRHGVPKWYTDAQALIDDPEVNAVYIATPPYMHLTYTRMAALAGKPVYVEKPMARNFEECQEMILVCEQAKIPLYVAYYRRALPHFLEIKKMMEEGAIGEIRTVHINLKQAIKPQDVGHMKDVVVEDNNWRIDPEIAGGGYFFDLASHQLDLLDFFFGPVENAQGFASNQAKAYQAEDLVVGNFVFENGVVGTGNWCFTSAPNSQIDDITIYGSKGRISFETFGNGEFFIQKEGVERQHVEMDLPFHIQQPLIKSIVEDLLETGTCPSTGYSGARTNRVMDQLVKSFYK
jgi:predicted dehydrogenase